MRTRPIVLLGVFVATSLLVWLAIRESSTERLVRLELAKLRAAKEPTTASELARMFPNPLHSEDASILFGPVFNAVTNSRSIHSNPVSFPNWTFTRAQSLSASVLQELQRFVAATRDLTNAWPSPIPQGTSFPMHWERGMTNSTIFSFVAVRSIVQLLVAHAAYATENGDSDAAAASLIKGFEFCRTLNVDGMIVGHMIRHGLEGLLCQTSESCLSKGAFSEEQLRRLSNAIEFETERAWSDALRAEHCMGLWAFDYLKNGGRFEDVFGGSDSEPFWKRIVQWFDRDRDRRPEYSDSDYLLYVRTISDRIRIAEMPAPRALIAAEEARDKYFSNAVSQAGSAAYPGFSKRIFTAHAEANARLHALKAALAIERKKLIEESPKTLEELVPRFLPAVPEDPFDGTLRFKTSALGYVVYSIGADGKDDGGTERTNTNMTANYDVTLTIER